LAAILLATPVVASGEVVPSAGGKGDPVEGVNRELFSVHQLLDRVFFRPVAMGYKAVVPRVVRTGIRHVISNLTEPVVFLNDVLQLKPKRAVRTFGRFTINTVLGVGGVIDVAKGEKLPHRNNGFGNTLGRYGVGPGPYLFIPLIGPTDLRDLIGGQADGVVLPLAVGKPFNKTEFIVPNLVLNGLDLRAESDADLKVLLGGAADPYATLRSVYLQSRAAEVAEVKGGTTGGALDDPLVDPEPAPTP
jgi:phospholipid-binding lipoprotein MlaA